MQPEQMEQRHPVQSQEDQSESVIILNQRITSALPVCAVCVRRPVTWVSWSADPDMVRLTHSGTMPSSQR